MPAKAKTIRRYINLPTRNAPLPFSDAVLVGDALYLSGRIGIDPLTGLVPDDVDLELSLLFDGFEAVLREANMSMNDLVWVQVLLARYLALGAFQHCLFEALLERASGAGFYRFGATVEGWKVRDAGSGG